VSDIKTERPGKCDQCGRLTYWLDGAAAIRLCDTCAGRSAQPPTVGDFIFTRWPGFDSRLTEKLTGGLSAHVEQIKRTEPLPVQVIAASRILNRMNTWTWDSRKYYFLRTGTAWARYTLKAQLTDRQIEVLRNYFEEAENSFNYSKGELLLQALDGVKNWLTKTPYDSPKAVAFRKAGNWIKHGVICSHVAALGFIRLGILPAHAEFWSPADLLKYVKASGLWELAEQTAEFDGGTPRLPPEPTHDPEPIQDTAEPPAVSKACSCAFTAVVLAALAVGGTACVCQPGGRITVNVGWRSAQAGSATNVVNGIEGGGNPTLTIPVSATP